MTRRPISQRDGAFFISGAETLLKLFGPSLLLPK